MPANSVVHWDSFRDFTRTEFMCKCGCGQAHMDWSFMSALQTLRKRVDLPFPINSGYRCESYNSSIGGGTPHPLGKAADIAVWGFLAREVLDKATKVEYGFTGIGLMQHGSLRDRFIHLDTLRNDETPATRPWIWTYSGE